MLFNSYIFIFAFLPITFLGYFLLNRLNLINISKYFLLSSSLFFYAYFDIKYLPILIISMVFNFYFGKILSNKKSKTYLTLGILFNVALLSYFKYMDFFIVNFKTR